MSMAIPLYGLLAWLCLRHSRSVAERVAGGAVVVLVAGTAAMARLVLSAHWPSDIVAGALLGGCWLVVVVRALDRALRNRRQRVRPSGCDASTAARARAGASRGSRVALPPLRQQREVATHAS
jgi:membrane-associated phospholipid phosphatase